MTTYFRDQDHGAGAIAANGRAHRAAPAPVVARAAGYEAAGAVTVGTVGNRAIPLRAVAPVRTTTPKGAAVAPARAATAKPPAVPTAPIRTKGPMAPAVPVKHKMMPANLFANLTASLAPTTPATTTVVVDTVGTATPKPKTVVSTFSGGGGGAVWSPSSGKSGGFSPLLPMPGAHDDVQVSATTAVAPKGGAKVWLVLGGIGAAFFAYRHFKKKRKR